MSIVLVWDSLAKEFPKVGSGRSRFIYRIETNNVLIICKALTKLGPVGDEFILHTTFIEEDSSEKGDDL